MDGKFIQVYKLSFQLIFYSLFIKISKMLYNLNTPQFVKTYGKPMLKCIRGTTYDSLWYNDFDKCLGIKPITFTLPESVTKIKHIQHKNVENKIKLRGWSLQLYYILTGHKAHPVTKYKCVIHKNAKKKFRSIGVWSLQLHSFLAGHKAHPTTNKR